jgi:HK97 family phage prohead protease
MDRLQHMLCRFNEIKLAPPDTSTMSFEGYGAVFGNVDAYGDVIEPGAFASYLSDAQNEKQAWPSMLLQHGGWGMTAEDMMPAGVWTDLAEDGKGLKSAGTLADIPKSRDAYTLMKMKPRPAIDGLSIGYYAREWAERSKPEDPRRTLKRIDLVEISLVTFPANGKARVSGVKAIGETEREIENWLQRDAGLSRREARIAISQGFKSLIGKQDAAGELEELAAIIRRNTQTLIPKGN